MALLKFSVYVTAVLRLQSEYDRQAYEGDALLISLPTTHLRFHERKHEVAGALWYLRLGKYGPAIYTLNVSSYADTLTGTLNLTLILSRPVSSHVVGSRIVSGEKTSI